jgi:predicted Zn-dependent protease
VKPLEPPDSHHLRAAIGWMELGNADAANEELERITPQRLRHPDVLEIRWHICALAKRWEAAAEAAAGLVQLDPERPDAWVHRSYALHELKRTEEAFDQLLPVADRFAEVWTISYNLACYCAQLGRLPEARAWLRRTFAIATKTRTHKGLRLRALEDPDLEPLREEIGNMGA